MVRLWGAVKAADGDPAGTAAREFHEETLGVVPFAETEMPEHGGAYRRSAAGVADALRAGAFTLRVGCRAEGAEVGYVTSANGSSGCPPPWTLSNSYQRAAATACPGSTLPGGPGDRSAPTTSKRSKYASSPSPSAAA